MDIAGILISTGQTFADSTSGLYISCPSCYVQYRALFSTGI